MKKLVSTLKILCGVLAVNSNCFLPLGSIDHRLEALVLSSIITSDPEDLLVGGSFPMVKFLAEWINESCFVLYQPRNAAPVEWSTAMFMQFPAGKWTVSRMGLFSFIPSMRQSSPMVFGRLLSPSPRLDFLAFPIAQDSHLLKGVLVNFQPRCFAAALVSWMPLWSQLLESGISHIAYIG